MSLKIELEMRDVLRKSSEEIIQQAEELINTSKFENNFSDYLSPLREIILEEIQWVQDLSVKISNLIDEHDDFTAEETLSIKFSIFTKTNLLLNHSFSQKHNSSNLQQSSLISGKEFSIMLNPLLTKTLV